MSYRKMACECNHEHRREIHSLAGLHDKQQQITDIFFAFFLHFLNCHSCQQEPLTIRALILKSHCILHKVINLIVQAIKMEISNVFLHRNTFGEMLYCVTCLPVVNGCHQNMSPNS